MFKWDEGWVSGVLPPAPFIPLEGVLPCLQDLCFWMSTADCMTSFLGRRGRCGYTSQDGGESSLLWKLHF